MKKHEETTDRTEHSIEASITACLEQATETQSDVHPFFLHQYIRWSFDWHRFKTASFQPFILYTLVLILFSFWFLTLSVLQHDPWFQFLFKPWIQQEFF